MANLLYSRSFIILLVAILILTIVALGREGYRYFRVSQEIRDLEKKIEALEKENEELAGMEKYFQSEDFLEKEARLKLNLTKPGEKLIIVKTPEDLEEEQEQEITKQVFNIQLWWDYFFGKK